MGSSATNRILGNELFDNGALGMDTVRQEGDGVTPNDGDDGDSSANNRQNYPVIGETYIAGDDTVVMRRAQRRAKCRFRLEFFASPACDARGFGAGVTSWGAARCRPTAAAPASLRSSWSRAFQRASR